jgi:hypothetical protein
MSPPRSDTHASDFRTFYANTFRVAFGGNEVNITYGIQKHPGTDDPSMDEQTSVIMSHAGAKTIATMLTMIISDFEEATDTVIKIDPKTLKTIEDMIAANKAMRKPSAPK